ncbi:hint-domain-containing protein [Hypomontagnella monticulosa]|nr:hint-domain-containing protein [Hypomontagnella monticulosa]
MDINLSIHPVQGHNGVIVRVQPPARPNHRMYHVPCDIVLVIDVSGSMQVPVSAKVDGEDGKPSSENFGLSILDMVKHAARTILSTLDEGDRLGIVTYSREALASGSHKQVVQRLIPMTHENKKLTDSNIERMKPESVTNLWHGIQKGVGLFDGEENTGRVPAVMILTDGLPNYMCPAQGYVPKITSTWEILPATLHTFGFSSEIRSGLLKSIAEIGGGNYAFIPDAGMIGTVFVHAVAHIQTTYATKCILELTTPKATRLKTTAGKAISRQEQEGADVRKLTINLGNLQYGQSRDIYLENIDANDKKAMFSIVPGDADIRGVLMFSQMRAAEFRVPVYRNALEIPDLSENEVAYHQSRSMICDFLSSFSPLKSDGEYDTRRDINPQRHLPEFRHLLETIPARLYHDEFNQSLMADLVGDLPSGQIGLALSKQEYFSQWGCHYYFSLWNAHAKQLCNSFKDPGPLMYNRNPFFIKCRDALDKAFDTLPPPKQSCPSVATTTRIRMAVFNRASGPCFTGSSKVTLADGRKAPVRKLRRGSRVRTPLGNRRVVSVLKTAVRDIVMCGVGGVVITPWHPIRIGGVTGSWVFPFDYACLSEQPQLILHSGYIYSVLLQPHRNPDAHALEIGGVWAVTLGHGVTQGNDTRAHQFLGDYGKVTRALSKMTQEGHGIVLSSGVEREGGEGFICGFKKYLPYQHLGTNLALGNKAGCI